MKRLFCAILAFTLLLTSAAFAAPETIDLETMPYDELVALKDRINLAMWASEEWQEVTVPQGVYAVGQDIPAGHWTITPVDGAYAYVKWGDVLDESGKNLDYGSQIYVSESITSETYSYYEKGKDKTQCDFDVKGGHYLVIESGDVVFTPYTGKPDLGFK